MKYKYIIKMGLVNNFINKNKINQYCIHNAMLPYLIKILLNIELKLPIYLISSFYHFYSSVLFYKIKKRSYFCSFF